MIGPRFTELVKSNLIFWITYYIIIIIVIIIINILKMAIEQIKGLNQCRVPGSVAQSLTCLMCVWLQIKGSRVQSRPGPILSMFVEIDHDIISRVILLPSANSFKKGCC